jgi:hypothetical protein
VASTEGNNYDRVGHSFQVGLQTPLCDRLPILKNLILDIIGDFTVANYYHYSAEVFPPESLARLDHNWGLLVRLTYPLNRYMSLQAYYHYINANNRNDIFQHDRHVGGTALLFTY